MTIKLDFLNIVKFHLNFQYAFVEASTLGQMTSFGVLQISFRRHRAGGESVADKLTDTVPKLIVRDWLILLKGKGFTTFGKQLLHSSKNCHNVQ